LLTGSRSNSEGSKLLRVIEIEHVHNATLAVEQQHPAVLTHPLLIAWEPGQLIFAGQGQGLCLPLKF
jgi:hypothetical protein